MLLDAAEEKWCRVHDVDRALHSPIQLRVGGVEGSEALAQFSGGRSGDARAQSREAVETVAQEEGVHERLMQQSRRGYRLHFR